MARPHAPDSKQAPDPKPAHDAKTPAFVPGRARTCYLVVRHQDVWLIKFEGEEYGPYETEREAKLFAIDAAHKLGEQGEVTQVLLMDESGQAKPAWSYGQDPYPPRQ
jgi:hypothetical protein